VHLYSENPGNSYGPSVNTV